MSKQPVRVNIFNQTYTLLAEEDANEVHAIAHQIDQLMTSIADHTGSGDPARVAVLACLHLADQLRDAEKRLKAFESRSGEIVSLLERGLAEALQQS